MMLRLTSPSVEISVGMLASRVVIPGICLLGLAHKNLGRVARTNLFEVMFRVMRNSLRSSRRSSEISQNLLHPYVDVG